jgi:uncharacterized protein YecE (DUF72 family)
VKALKKYSASASNHRGGASLHWLPQFRSGESKAQLQAWRRDGGGRDQHPRGVTAAGHRSDIAYVRFHGHSAKWERAATRNERYDYAYTDEELQGWVEPIVRVSGQAKETYVYFNNHYRDRQRRMLRRLEGFLESYIQGSQIPPI